ncbi:uncharacterized protein LOC144031774 [Festucalex cinctus]
MEDSHCCVDCGILFEASDVLDDRCPRCLVSDRAGDGRACSPGVSDPSPLGHLSSSQPRRRKRLGVSSAVHAPPRKRAAQRRLASEVGHLQAELAKVRSLLQDRHPPTLTGGPGPPALPMPRPSTPPMPVLPPEEDAISLAASASFFNDDDRDPGSVVLGPNSPASAQSSSSEAGDSSIRAVLRNALDLLHLEVPPQAQSASESAFFRRRRPSSAFSVPASDDYLRELHACWRDPGALSRPSADGRDLASMHGAASVGLDRMPAVEPAVASLIVSPEETLRPSVRCPRPQCRVTDDLLTRAYGAGARAGRIGNSLAHLMLALSTSLQADSVEAAVSFSDAALQAFALMTREHGRLMSFLVQARRQVWLAQSPLSEASRRALRGVPVEPGELFGSAAVGPCLPNRVGLGHPLLFIAFLSPDLPRLMAPGDPRRGPPWVFTPPPACLQGNHGLQAPPAVPLGPLGAGGAGTEALGPAVGHFSHQQLSYWAARASDPWLVSILTHGYELQFRRRPPASCRVRMTLIADPAKASALDQELSTLLAKDAIEAVDPLAQPGGFYSTYFLVPKKTGGYRPILDLRGLNRHLKVLPFHMLTKNDVLQSLAQGEWFTSIDLKDAYFHVPIAPRHRRFLRFAYKGRHWQFRVLPFGLSLAPRVFTRFVRAALAPLQSVGMKVLPYLDDWLLCAPSRAQVIRDTSDLLSHVARLGIRVNLPKSSLVPSQRTDFIGVTLDTTVMRAHPSPHRVDDVLRLLAHFRGGRLLPYVAYLRLLGKLTSMTAVVPLGLLTLRPLQRWLNGFHLDAKWHRHRRLRVSRRCLLALAPWRERAFLLSGVPLGVAPARRETVTTDASLTGWGAVWQHRTAQGIWSVRDRADHINVLELRAVHLALMHFLPYLSGRHVLIRSDNTTTVFHINHQGGVRSARLLEISQLLLRWAAPRLASLRATYLPGVRNQLADSLSRRGPPPGEWRLHPEVVRMIWSCFGTAEVDLFASEASTHCPLWFSLNEATSPLGLDALAQPWPECLLYAFPPLPLIWLTLQRVLQEGHTLLLVAPFWPARTWFPLLRQLCSGEPWRLPDREDLLSQQGGRVWHPDPRRLRLCVWPLRGPNRC